MNDRIDNRCYDVIIAGARCAGASTALLLARAGLRVLVVDPARRGTDTLSTHALMRGGVRQLHRWGLLDEVRASGATPISTTTFHYADVLVAVPIKPRDGVDALYAPRRFVLDAILAGAAEAAGATIANGLAVSDVLRDADGRVRGVVATGPEFGELKLRAELVIGADGANSKVARTVHAEFDRTLPHASATVYGYMPDPEPQGYHWYYAPGASVGLIPTSGGETCVFASLPPERFLEARGRQGLEAIHADVVRQVDPGLADRLAAAGTGKLRAFAGRPSHLRRATGPGWALVGDAGFFRDPITAHGITDALREAELLAGAVLAGPTALSAYGAERNERVTGLLEVTDRLASFAWTLEEAREEHLRLAREMKRLAELPLEPYAALAVA